MVACLVYIRTTGNLCGGLKAALGLRHMPFGHVINRQPVSVNKFERMRLKAAAEEKEWRQE
jgi:hypothetical protein